VLDSEEPTEVSVAVDTAPAQKPAVVSFAPVQPWRGSRAAVAVIASLILSGGIAATVFFRRSGTVEAPHAVAGSSEAPEAVHSSAPEPPSTAAVAPSASSIEVADAPNPRTSSSSSGPSRRPASRARPPGRAMDASCSPNYRVDERGIKHFKPECM
jgi:hypothetical protein